MKVFIDYAHTPDALLETLKSLKNKKNLSDKIKKLKNNNNLDKNWLKNVFTELNLQNF